jgi:light-harvesting complex 1 beta chain
MNPTGSFHRPTGQRKGAIPMIERKGSISGLTDDEAQEFHKYYVQGFIGFTAIAIVAHILVWSWRPWL